HEVSTLLITHPSHSFVVKGEYDECQSTVSGVAPQCQIVSLGRYRFQVKTGVTGCELSVSFFFSSRRRHTRLQGDWSSDVCSSDLGQPRQERWMAAHRDTLPGVVMVGVGAAFDFHAGRIRQAPRWMQNAGLEWSFRSEERRVGKECR